MTADVREREEQARNYIDSLLLHSMTDGKGSANTKSEPESGAHTQTRLRSSLATQCAPTTKANVRRKAPPNTSCAAFDIDVDALAPGGGNEYVENR